MTRDEQRARFLTGEGTLTVREIREWAHELAPWLLPLIPPAGMSDDEPLMVSVLPQPETRGLAGARIL
jgi:hypothetical protein